ARRGAIVTVERVVDDLSPWAERVLLPAHRVLAIVEAPFGAHPGGVFARGLPTDGYGEDVEFWVGARDAGRGDFDAWAKTWGVDTARTRGHATELTAELGLWGYHPTPADPYIFNQRSFPAASRLSDASNILGQVIGGQGNTVIGCLGAAQVDRHGNINSTLVP